MQNDFVKEIYLHIGLHKTGTSSIQATLAENAQVLESKSIFYLTEMGINHSEFLVPMFMENPSEFYLEQNKNQSEKDVKKLYNEKQKKLKDILFNVRLEKIVFSGEDISGMSEAELKNFHVYIKSIFPLAKIKIVICFRDPSDYVASALQQSCKTGFCSVRPFEYKNIHYKNLIEKFALIFDINDFFLYDFEVAKKNHLGLVGYFLEHVLQINNLKTSNIKILRDNDSITDIAVHIIKSINTNTSSSLFAKGEDGGMLKYERYLNDTQALWSLKGDKFKLDKTYVQELYEKLQPELKWLRENFNIDYNFENATYTEERYKIPDSFFKTIREAFPKLSRIVRRSFYDWICEEIQTRKDDEFKELEKTKKWIEKNYQALVSISLDDLKKQINKEIEACQNFFNYFRIENKQSYQLYYHLHLLLKEIGEHKASNVMLQHFYEKNPYWNDKWEGGKCARFKYSVKQLAKKILKEKSLMSLIKKNQNGYENFTNVFYIYPEKENLIDQIVLFLQKHNIQLKSYK